MPGTAILTHAHLFAEFGVILRNKAGEWMSEDGLKEKGLSERRLKAIKRQCMKTGAWKFDYYEAGA